MKSLKAEEQGWQEAVWDFNKYIDYYRKNPQ